MSQTPKLSKDPVALVKLKEIYARSPRPSLAAIGREIGYSKATVNDNINRLKKLGEL
jgi:biotin operon repressor